MKLDPGLAREQANVLFLLLGRREGASVGELCARSNAPVASAAEEAPMCSSAPRDWLPVRDLELGRRLRSRDRGAAFPVPTQVGRLVQCLDGRGVAHPSDPLEKLALAIWIRSSGLDLAEQRRKDLLCLSDLRHGLGLIDVAGLPTTIIPTIPMP